MQDWEKELLKSAYTTSTEQKRIESGNLYDYQIEALNEMRGAVQYLEDKYPSADTKIIDFQDKNMLNNQNSFSFTVEDSGDTYQIIQTELGIFKDNYYADLIQPKYDDYLMATLKSEGYPVVAVKTDFTLSQGMEMDGSQTVEQILSTGSSLPRDTAIYMSVKDEAICENMKNYILEHDIYGSYRIYSSDLYMDYMNPEECYDIWLDNRDEIITISFPCHNN